MSEKTIGEVCVACAHDIEKHVQTVIGTIRCLVVEHGETTKGVIGLPWQRDCPCRDYQMPKQEHREPR
jgi:hypothetical protein